MFVPKIAYLNFMNRISFPKGQQQQTGLTAQIHGTRPPAQPNREVIVVSETRPAIPIGNGVYPEALWRLYDDLCTLWYHSHKLTQKEREELEKRLPGGLRNAEEQADALLYDYIRRQIRQIGPNEYAKLAAAHMSAKARKMLLFRCAIACLDRQPRQADTIEIRHNKMLDTIGLLSLAKLYGYEVADHVLDEEEKPVDIKPLAEKDVFTVVVKEEIPTKENPRDRLPDDVLGEVRRLFSEAGVAFPGNLNLAWTELEALWMDSTVDEKIVSRIAYLIVQATAGKQEAVPLLAFSGRR
jgi:hypothetical protein